MKSKSVKDAVAFGYDCHDHTQEGIAVFRHTRSKVQLGIGMRLQCSRSCEDNRHINNSLSVVFSLIIKIEVISRTSQKSCLQYSTKP